MTRRLAILSFIVIWLILLSLPGLAFSLAARGQLQMGETEGNHLRIFLLQERDAEGIGLERAQIDQADSA